MRIFRAVPLAILQIALLCVCLPLPAYGDDGKIEHKHAESEVMQMDIEDLMSISVASKRPEKIKDAPGVITVITEQDIKNYGANDLRDVLQRLPNVYPFSTGIFRDSTTSVRGQSPSTSDAHALILLNGRPMRESFNGTVTAPVYRNIPLEIIEKIEVIRGPGSVLYGSNAFAGVINIITKDPAKAHEHSVSAGYGSFGTASASAAFVHHEGEIGIVGAARYLDSHGWTYRASDQFNNQMVGDFTKRNYGYFAQGAYKGLTVTGFSGHVDDVAFPNATGPSPVPDPTSDMVRNFFDVQYEKDISASWKSKFNFTYNGTDMNSQGRTRNIDEYLFEPSVSGVLFDKVNIVAGFTYHHIDGRMITEHVVYGNDRFGGYLQADYSPLDYLKLIGGFQINKPQGVDYDISPRGGAILSFSQNTGFKLLYGQAFRSALMAEQVTTGITIGNPSLAPEKIGTFDAQLFYTSLKYHLALTYYQSRQTNSIRAAASRVGFTTINQGTIDYQGIELEGKASISKNLELTGSITRQFNEDNTGNTEIGLVPRFMAKVGISYNWDRGYSLGIFNSWFGRSALLPNSRQVNHVPGSYDFLTAKVSLNLRKFLQHNDVPDLTFSVYGENLLDEVVYFPENTGTVNSLPLRSGIAFFGNVALRF